MTAKEEFEYSFWLEKYFGEALNKHEVFYRDKKSKRIYTSKELLKKFKKSRCIK